MSPFPVSPNSDIIDILSDRQDDLYNLWSEQLLTMPTQRLDLIDPASLRKECEEVLIALNQVLPAAAGETLDADSWKPLRDLLGEISRNRDNMGFMPSDTAEFVLSLKRPLLTLIEVHLKPARRTDAFWQATKLVDRLALYTTEVYQRRRDETITRQREEMEELSTPVVKVWDGILAMPLIGTLDTRRSQMVTEALLEALSSSGSEIAILDLTGVPAVDTRMAQHLMRTVSAARLMGADCILCGIRPQIAQTIVHLQINLGDIVTEASLASALRTAFRRTGLQVTPRDE
jgi:rsbT co-antagonist protein RsbR